MAFFTFAILSWLSAASHERALRRALRSEQQNEQLQRLTREKDGFLATMSHEMKTPLNGLLGFLQLATNPIISSDSDAMHFHLTKALNCGGLLLAQIDDILDATRLDTGAFSIHVADGSIARTVLDAVELMSNMARGKGIALRAEMADELRELSVRIDARRLNQVLINLISNALKFTNVGEVVVSASITERHINVGADDAARCYR